MSIFYVYAAFAACFLPYTCTKLAIATTGHNLVLKGVFQFSMTLGLLNSSLNKRDSLLITIKETDR